MLITNPEPFLRYFKAGYSIVPFIAVDVGPSRVKKAAEELSKLPEVDVLGIATGAHDILMQLTSFPP